MQRARRCGDVVPWRRSRGRIVPAARETSGLRAGGDAPPEGDGGRPGVERLRGDRRAAAIANVVARTVKQRRCHSPPPRRGVNEQPAERKPWPCRRPRLDDDRQPDDVGSRRSRPCPRDEARCPPLRPTGQFPPQPRQRGPGPRSGVEHACLQQRFELRQFAVCFQASHCPRLFGWTRAGRGGIGPRERQQGADDSHARVVRPTATAAKRHLRLSTAGIAQAS